MRINNHRLIADDGTPVRYVETPNKGGLMTPEYLIMHYTAGSSAEGSVSWMCNPAAKAAAHLVIGRDGSLTQLAPFNRITWHAGKSEWEGRSGLNGFSIGIELDNAGKLERELMHSYAASPNRTLLDLRLPAALPFIFSALKVNATLALIGAIVAEFFGSPTAGLGFRISIEATRMNMPLVWSAIVVASIVGSVMYALLVRLDARINFWHPSIRSQR